MITDPIRSRLKTKRSLAMGWMALGSPLAIEVAAAAGVDVINVDHQHGQGGPNEMVHQIMATRAAGIGAFVRIANNDVGLVSRALDAGAQGIICPMVNTRDEAEAFVRSVKYPPLGARSYGPYAAGLLTESLDVYFTGANAWTIACGQIETAEAVENLDAILSVEGFDMAFVGPNDLAISLSGGKSRDPMAPACLKVIDHIFERCEAHGLMTGIFANDEAMCERMMSRGWQMVAMHSDAKWIQIGAKAFASLTAKANAASSKSSPKRK